MHFVETMRSATNLSRNLFNLQKENPVEVLNVHCTVQDQAGNENEADYEVMVTYTGLDAEALLEKTGLIMQIADTSYERRKKIRKHRNKHLKLQKIRILETLQITLPRFQME